MAKRGSLSDAVKKPPPPYHDKPKEQEFIPAYGLQVLNISITNRVAFGHALIDGLAVTEFEPDGKAAKELKALWQWLKPQM